MVYMIGYDLKKPGQDYSTLYGAIRAIGPWWHFLESTWLVDTTLSARRIWVRLAPHVDQNDRVLVIRVTQDSDGWLTEEAWKWINARVSP